VRGTASVDIIARHGFCKYYRETERALTAGFFWLFDWLFAEEI